MSAMHLAIGKVVRLFTRKMYQQIDDRQTWSAIDCLTTGAKEELEFWADNNDRMNGCYFKPQNTTTQMIFTDASDTGYGGYMVHRLGEQICAGSFTNEESNTSSTFRELLAVKLVLQSYGTMLKNQSIQINTDNQAASRILAVGSAKPHLQSIAIQIFHYCIKNNIKLSPEWIPRELNQNADYLSKIRDSDSFEKVQQRFGPCDVDRFADDMNKKVEVFNFKYHCPGTYQINAFTSNWADIPDGNKNRAVRQMNIFRTFP